MSAEIIYNTPASGDYNEIHFGQNFNYRLWVKFIDNNFEEWAGCFTKPYDGGFNKVLIDNTNTRAFVVASGKGYLIDITDKKLILALDEHPAIESVIKTSNPDYFVAGTFYSIYILDNQKLVNEIKADFIIDGIYFKEQQGNLALGDLSTAENQYEKKVDFEFDLTTFNLTLKTELGLLGQLWKKLTG